MDFDLAVIGAGTTGCAVARHLSRLDLRIALLDATEDVAGGASRANSAIVHAGFDAPTGSLMARLNVRGNERFESWCRDLSVPFRRCGSLVAAFSDADTATLRSLLARGESNGVPGLRLVSGDEARALEPRLSKEAVAALWAPTAAIACPYEFCIACAENARANGAVWKLGAPVSAMRDAGDAVDPQTAGFSLAEVQTNFENVQKRLEAAKAEEERLRNERESARATERANADEEKRLAELREELKKVREEAQSATDAPSAPDNPNLVYYEFPDGVREKPWYVDISGGNIVAVPSDPDETRREFASPEEFVAWAKTRSRVNEYFVLIARPSGAAKFDAISLELEDLHFKLGIDLVAEKRELQFIPPRKKGARR